MATGICSPCLASPDHSVMLNRETAGCTTPVGRRPRCSRVYSPRARGCRSIRLRPPGRRPAAGRRPTPNPMSEANSGPEVPPEGVRTPVIRSPRRCPVCQAVDLTGRQTVCSASAGHGHASGRRRRGKRGTGRSGHS